MVLGPEARKPFPVKSFERGILQGKNYPNFQSYKVTTLKIFQRNGIL
jgi:hypothetical protein